MIVVEKHRKSVNLGLIISLTRLLLVLINAKEQDRRCKRQKLAFSKKWMSSLLAKGKDFSHLGGV